MKTETLQAFEDSLKRCDANPGFLDRFYETFLASSPKVRKKFVSTDFVRQKRALRASLHHMLVAASDEDGPGKYLSVLATRHGRHELDIGAELYDLWLDSLLVTVRASDPEWSSEVEAAWESVMTVGIRYLLSHYDDRPADTAGGS